jgi:hypothetical protein
MAIKKIVVKQEVNKKEELIKLLKAKTPALFDREPTLTGNVEKLADEICNLLCI